MIRKNCFGIIFTNYLKNNIDQIFKNIQLNKTIKKLYIIKLHKANLYFFKEY